MSLPFWRWRSIFTPHRDLGASGPVLGGGRCWGVSLFGVLCSLWSPPCFNTPRLPVASNRRLHNLAAPRTGRIGHCLKKVAAAEPGFPEVPWGIPRRVGLPPFRGSCWGFRGGFDFWALLGCVWPACPMCIRHSVGLEHSCSSPRWGAPVRGRLEPLSSAWLGSLHSFCCARLTLVFGTASQNSFATHWHLPETDRRGAAGPDVPAPWHGRGGEAAGSQPSDSLNSWNSRAFRWTRQTK